MYKRARLRVPLESKLPGAQGHRTQRRAGTQCLAQRHSTDPGSWVLWFGREFAVVTAISFNETVELVRS